MALLVNTNISSLSNTFHFQNISERLSTSFERLSSGNRINSARDDAAGLQLSDRLTIQILGLNQATRNANDGISISQVAESSLSEMTTNIQRMSQLSIQAGNGTLTDSDRNALSEEFLTLLETNENFANETSFGGRKLLNGDTPNGFSFQTGVFESARTSVTTGNATFVGLLEGIVNNDSTITASAVGLSTASAATLSQFGVVGNLIAAYVAVTTFAATAAVNEIFGVDGSDIGTLSEIATNSLIDLNFEKIASILSNPLLANPGGDSNLASIFTNGIFDAFSVASVATAVDSTVGFSSDQLTALRNFSTDQLVNAMSDLSSRVSSLRATLGADQNGLSSIVRANSFSIFAATDARSRILDTDFALETAELTRNLIIQQIAASVGAQANSRPELALSLLR